MKNIDSTKLSYWNIAASVVTFVTGLLLAIFYGGNARVLRKIYEGTGRIGGMVTVFIVMLLLLVASFVLLAFCEYLQGDSLIQRKNFNGAFPYFISTLVNVLFLSLNIKYISALGQAMKYSLRGKISCQDLSILGFRLTDSLNGDISIISIGLPITLCIIAGLSLILELIIVFRWDFVKDYLKNPVRKPKPAPAQDIVIAKPSEEEAVPAESPKIPGPRFCPECGAPLKAESHFCPNYGKSIN